MSRQQIKFSIITVYLNTKATIPEIIHSVERQTYSGYEDIICDGLSQDNTVNIIKENTGNSKLKLFTEQDSGLYNAMNRAMQKCSGDYVRLLNSGDTWQMKWYWQMWRSG